MTDIADNLFSVTVNNIMFKIIQSSDSHAVQQVKADVFAVWIWHQLQLPALIPQP